MADIKGTPNNDTLTGTIGFDLIEGLAGDDSIRGLEGSDTLNGGEGHDTLITDDNDVSNNIDNYYDDFLNGGIGDDYINSGAGNDLFRGNKGDDTLIAGEGNDFVNGESGDDSIDAGAGNDEIADGIGNNILIAGEGRDTVGAGVGNDSIDAGADNDFIMGSSNLVTQVYEGLVSGYDELVNENLALTNLVFGYKGDDTLIPGGDYEVGDDFIKAGTGNDFMILYGGDNTLLAGAGDDEVLGGIDNDFINGGAGNDFVFGYEGDDTLIAGEGNDRLIGSAGNDRLIGIAENSTTFGKGEIDTLQGKVGSDRFVLGDATQTFYNDEDNGSEGIEDCAVIQDFNPSEDVIELSEAEGIYLLGNSPIEGISGTGLYIDQLDSETDELVAVIEGLSPDDLDINASYFANWNNPAIDDAPVVEHEIVDVTVNEDSENTVIDLTNVFSDVDGDAIAISLVDNTNSNLVTGTIVNNQLTLDYLENQFGTSEITIRGTSNSQTVDETFAITVNPVDDVLVVNDTISDVVVTEDAENTVIDLANVFRDVDGEPIILSLVENTNQSLITASIVDEQLTLDYQNNQFGTSEITIRGTSNGQTIDDTFAITVNPIDDAPVIKNAIADLTVNEDAENTVIDLSNVFNDVDNDDNTIIKTVSSNDNESLVNTSLEGDNLILDYLSNQSGIANITIQGTSNGQTIDAAFTINVNETTLSKTNVHRFYQYEKGSYLYSSEENEIQVVQEKSEAGELAYNYEQEKFTVLADNKDILTGQAIEGVAPVYRFFNTDTGSHLYTMDETEKEYIQDNLANYSFEGIEYYAFESEPEALETVPVYRMLNSQSGAHLFTVDQAEINYIQENLPHFSLEGDRGIAFYVIEL